MSLVTPFVSAFHAVLPLQANELELLFDLLRARLAATISIMRWRIAQRGADDEYTSLYSQGESDAEAFLLRLNSLGRSAFLNNLKNAI
jgi:Ser/Thr protein kinase RdoA (MazF antagonist)